MIVHQFVNSICDSNTYVFYSTGDSGAWLIDPGDSEPVVRCLLEMRKQLQGILVTHSHHDHIYGINDIQRSFPMTKIFAAEKSIPGFFSAKQNMSRYYLRPFCVEPQDVLRIGEGTRIPFAANADIGVIETPGHHPGALCFSVMNELFTGDSLLPTSPVTTVLPGGDREQAKQSVRRLFDRFGGKTCIHPGHGDECLLETINYDTLFRRPSRPGEGLLPPS